MRAIASSTVSGDAAQAAALEPRVVDRDAGEQCDVFTPQPLHALGPVSPEGYRQYLDQEGRSPLADPCFSTFMNTSSSWTHDELDRIGAAEELELASVHRDGTLRRPVTMWVVRVGDELYVRSVSGRGSSWFRGAQTRHEAQIRAGGVDKDVELVETDGDAQAIDAAYDAKYGRRYPTIVPSIVAPQARAATLKLVPH